MFDREKTQLAAGLSLIGLTFNITGCSTGSVPTTNPIDTSTPSARAASIKDYDNGVYTFPASKEFPQALSEFRKSHPELKIVSVSQGLDKNQASEGASMSWGAADTFIVVTEKK